jgi:ribonuclease D
LKHLCRELLDVEIDKTEQSSDWGGEILSPEQLKYAGGDVLFLHNIKEKLDALLVRENRLEMAQACFDFLPYRAQLDVMTSENFDIFAHSSRKTILVQIS